MLSQTNLHRLAISRLDLLTAHISCLHIMQSIFSPAARRDTRREGANLDRRDGELKMDWTKPPHDVRPMCIDCRLELW